MKKLILIVSCLIVLASCSLTKPAQDTPSNLAQTGTHNASSTNYKQDIDNTSSKIKDTTEFQDCMKQQTNMCIQSTGMQIAQKNKDTTFCKELSTPEEQSSCEFAITMVNAQEKNDEKLCDVLKNVNYLKQCKIQVYRQAAITKNDVTLCDKIDDVMKSAPVTSEASMQKDQCIMQYVSSNVDSKESDCKKLSTESSIDMCKTMLKNKPRSPELSTHTIPPIPNR